MDFTAGAWIASTSFPKHDREGSHYGTEEDDDIVLIRAIGPYPAGTTLDVFLGGLYGALIGLQATNPTVASFTAAALLSGGVARLDAVLRRTITATPTANAYIVRGGVSSFTAGAWLRPAPASFTANALFADMVC